MVSKLQEFQEHLRIVSEDVQAFVSYGSSSSKQWQTSTWKTTRISQGSEGTNWPCWPWPASPAPPPPCCPWAQEAHCSSALDQAAMKKAVWERAARSLVGTCHGLAELCFSPVLTQTRLQVRLCLAMHLNYPLDLGWPHLLSLTCSARLAWGQGSCTLPAPAVQQHFQSYTLGRGFTEVRSNCKVAQQELRIVCGLETGKAALHYGKRQCLVKLAAHIVSTFKCQRSSTEELKKIASILLLPDHKEAPRNPAEARCLLY